LRKTALITGASSGIGYELSKVFAKNGYNLVLVSRNTEKLKIISEEIEKQHGIQVIAIQTLYGVGVGPEVLFRDGWKVPNGGSTG